MFAARKLLPLGSLALGIVLSVSARAEEAGSAATKILSGSPRSWAPDSKTETLLRSLSVRSRKFSNWKADIVHEQRSVGLGKSTIAQGSFSFGAPNKFRYELKDEFFTVFASDGNEGVLLQYPEGKSKPALVKKFKDLDGVALVKALVDFRGFDLSQSDRDRFFRQFGASVEEKSKGHFEVVLLPREEFQVQRIVMQFSEEVPVPTTVEVTDVLGNTTKVEFKNPQSVEIIDPLVFRVAAPPKSIIETIGDE